MNRLVVVVADGLRADACVRDLGYVQALVRAGRGRQTAFACELPGVSRPLYATLITGRAPLEHGVVANQMAGATCGRTLFHALRERGGTSVVAAYHWFWELIAGRVFTPGERASALPDAGVVAGQWYFVDEYPDTHTFADAECARRTHAPDLVWVHPMGLDHAGHLHGGASPEYRYRALMLDAILAQCVPAWHADGYDVALTSDHGMHADRMHGGTGFDETQVPFVWLPRNDDGRVLPGGQTAVCGFLAEHLGASMRMPG